MERSCPQSDTGRPPRAWRKCFRGLTLVISTLALTVALPTAANAEPDDSEDLQQQVEKLGRKVEKITEQYNSLRVKLKEAEQAAESAKQRAQDKRAEITKLKKRVGRMASVNYKTGGLNSAVALAASDDPQSFLDRAATLHHLSRQDLAQIHALRQSLETIAGVQKEAEQRVAHVEELKSKIGEKKSKIEGMLADAEEELQKARRASRASASSVSINVPGSGVGAAAVQIALAQQGEPYVYGAAGPNQFDCSGLVKYAYGQVGVSLPHYTGAQYQAGTPVSKSALKPGDIVFFYDISQHNGMYVGNGKVVHAPHSGSVVQVVPLNSMPFAGAARV